MEKLFSEQEFQNARQKDKLPLRCKQCKNVFHRNKHEIQSVINKTSAKTGWFCSNKCKAIFYAPPPQEVQCEQCLCYFYKNQFQIKNTKHNFCCQSCAAKYNNAHKTTGTKISKLEIWIQKQLLQQYAHIEFHFNRKDAINSELDIYIPKYKLAFELNGIFHYEPIYGDEKLNQIQNNDNRKFQACIENGIELCIIDSSAFKNFKEEKAKVYFNIISNIINNRILNRLDMSSL